MEDRITVEQFDEATDLLYSFIDKFKNDDSEDFSMQLIELNNLAYMQGWSRAINQVIDIADEMKYTGYNVDTLEELMQRIV